MARTSRKNPQPIKKTDSAVLFKAAGYVRISLEDKYQGEGGSLENQMLMIENYVNKSQDIKLCSMHTDNGYTGTNFNRPGFEALMDEIRQGKINCVIVKDLSRFGRDYMEAGNFIEIIFPQLGIRFISLNDKYDSFDPRCKGEGASIALKNMINSFYSKDLSLKIRSAHEIKQKNGEYTGSFPPYGYLKSPENKKKLIIDPEASEVVKKIFALKLEGLLIHQIAVWLNENNIPTPGHYRYITGIFLDKRYKNPQIWNYATVMLILKSVVYLGHLVYGKLKVNPDQLYDYKKQPKKNWLIIENTHEALVSQSDFDLIDEMLNQRNEQIKKRNHKKWDNPENIFKGITYCADCGHIFSRKRITSPITGYTTYAYICASCKNGSHDRANRHYLKEKDLYDAIYVSIQQQITVCADIRRVIEKMREDDSGRQEQINLENEINQAQTKLDRLPVLKLKLYDDYCANIIDESEYQLFGKKFNEEEAELTKLLEQLNSDMNKFMPEFINDNKRLKALEFFENEKNLTRDMLISLVQRIEVGGDLTVHIIFRYEDEYDKIKSFIPEIEVV